MTNSDDFLKNNAKPQLVEVGPYVFDEYHKKVDLVWNEENGTVTYRQVRTFQWRPEESAGHLLNDSFIILNIPAATVGATAANLPAATRWFDIYFSEKNSLMFLFSFLKNFHLVVFI